MLELGVTIFIIAVVVIAIVYIISIWIYKRAPANMGFIRTGFLGTKVCVGQGAVVLPVFHEITWVSLETIKLIVSRARDQAVLTSDKIRVDVIVELYAHVGRTEDDVLVASRSLGDKTFDPDRVRSLLEAKIVSALRSHAATKTLSELHENREDFAKAIKGSAIESFQANGLTLEEATIVTLEQAGKEYFKTDNIFDAEGLKIITAVTSDAKRKVHETEKRTTVAIRQKDLDTQLELLEIERKEAFARAGQDKDVSNEQALQLGQKQVYVLDQRMSVEQREIENEKELERMRTERDVAVTEEAQKRQTSEIRMERALEAERREKEIALIAKAKEEELADVERKLELEKAERDRQIALIAKAEQEELADIGRDLARQQAEKDREIEMLFKEQERQRADIQRITAVTAEEEAARKARHAAAEDAALDMRKRSLETRLAVLDIDKDEAVATTQQEREVSDEKARVLAEKQRFIIEQRWAVQQEEITKEEALERARIAKETAVIEESKQREAAEVRRALAREQEERDREIALVGKAEELEAAKRDREIALVAKDEALRIAEERQAKAVALEEREREIAIIQKEQEREKADIQRFLAREQEERDREIALVRKTRELESAEVERLATTAEKERAEHEVESVRVVADEERAKVIEVLAAEKLAEAQRVEEEAKAQISSMHMLSQSTARKEAAAEEAEAILARARANSEAQQIGALGIEREAGAAGRAEMEIEALRAENARRMLEAEAGGIEAKADALKKYNDAATFLELAKLHIEAERDIHIDQAKAMGNALQNAQIRMYGGGGGDDGTIDTLRGLFTRGFGLGEVLEGVAQSLPEGLRERFAANGIRGLFGRPYPGGSLTQAYAQLEVLVGKAMRSKKAREIPVAEAMPKLVEAAGEDEAGLAAVAMLREFNQQGAFDDVAFETVWSLLQAAAAKLD